MVLFLNLSLILKGNLSLIAFLSGAILSGEKQMRFIICYAVCSWQVTYSDDPVFGCCNSMYIA